MLIQKEDNQTSVSIKAYQPGEITLNIGRYSEVIFLSNGLVEAFKGAKLFNELTIDELESALVDLPEILIIGTGEKHQLLPIKIVQTLNDRGVAVEAMASRQACHTYQVLMFEQRRICALIYP
jgi:uncharacterized protein